MACDPTNGRCCSSFRRPRDERGAVAVFFALTLTLFIIILTTVINIGEAFEHHRHLQLEADAAALAGGAEFASGSCNDANVVSRAFEYGGLQQGNIGSNTNWSGAVTSYSDTGAPFNTQIGGTPPSKIFEAINSNTFLPSGNTAPADNTNFTSNSPCTDSMLDVKMTETNLPWYFQAVGVPFINAHARVNWSAVGTSFLPFAVDETSPNSVWAYFVDERTGQPISGMTPNPVPLTNMGAIGGAGKYAGDDTWVNSSVTLPINAPDTEVIVALSGDKTTSSCTAQPVTCFNQNTGSGGFDLVNIQGYSTSGTGSATAPLVRSLRLPNSGTATCPSAVGIDSYLTNTAAACTALVQATVDIGSASPANERVWVRDQSGTCTPLVYNTPTSPPGPYDGTWTGSVAITSGSGADQLDIVAGIGTGKNKATCSKTSTPLTGPSSSQAGSQSSFASTTTSAGTIDGVILSQGGQEAPNSYPLNSSQTISISADIGGSLQDEEGSASNPRPPLIALNFGSVNTTSQTGTIACPPNNTGGSNSAAQLQANIESGCPGEYAINGAPPRAADPTCTNKNPGPGGSPPPPADCVQTKNGTANGPVNTGLFCRFVGGGNQCPSSGPSAGGRWYCTAAGSGNWANYDPSKPRDGFPTDDDRIVALFIVPYNSFNTSGLSLFPIQDFAFFYVAGFGSKGPTGDPCATDPPAPAGSRNATMWGYFIKYTSNTGGIPNPSPCTSSTLGACSIALTQ